MIIMSLSGPERVTQSLPVTLLCPVKIAEEHPALGTGGSSK